MMTEVCDNCGIALSDDGSCQPCLLRMGLSHAQDDNPSPDLPPEVEELASQFPHLEFIRLVGRGGMGAIYQARQKTLDRSVAVKVIARDISGDTNFLDRFEREAKTLGRLSHPNIVSVYDYGHTADSQAFLLMEYVDGCNLREAMDGKQAGVELPPVPELVIKICEALAYAHSKGVVHRDIKPENILLGGDGTIKVADFGIAKIVDHQKRTPTLTATRQVLGSVNYLAPEHLDDPNSVDHRVDVYALGVMMYELLTGRLPIGRIEAPSAVNPQIDARYDEIVLKALAYDPQQRFQSAEEVQVAVEEISSSGEAPVITPLNEAPKPVLNLPFTTEAHGGFAEAVGVASFGQDEVKLEYRIRDAFFGGVKSQTKVIRIPASRLLRIDLNEHWYGSHLALTADSITVFDEFPNAETGQLKIKVARSDLPIAREAAKKVGTQANIQHLQAAAQMTPEKESRWLTLGALFILSALVNAGLLAVSIVFLSDGNQRTDVVSRVFGIIMFSVFFGPVAILQLIAGIISLVDRQPALARAASIVSLLPIAPAWWLSGPTGLWALYWLNEDKPKKKRLAPTQNWTSATMVLLRENRWARIVAVANAAGIVLAVGGFIFWQGGFYSSQVRYRIVDDSFHDSIRPVPQQSLTRPVIERLARKYPVEILGSQLVVKGNRRDRESIIEALAIESPVELVVVPSSSNASESESKSDDLKELLGKAVTQEIDERQRVQLVSSYVSSIAESTREQVSLELSQAGRKALKELESETDKQWLMILDELIVGFATSDGVAGKNLKFQIQSDREFTVESLTAAIRGPAIPSDLELLN